jgi:transcriptional regulator with XRE-family HTH domain
MARPRRPEFHPRLADFRKRAGLTQEEVAEQVGISAEMVRRHERGDNLPISLYRKRYCHLFGATEEDLGFRLATGPVQDHLATGAAPGSMPSLGSPVAAVNITPADFGDARYLEEIQEHIREIVALDNLFGGADLVRMSARLFRSVHGLLDTGAYDPRLERDLHAAAGEMAEVVGWLAYDAEEHDLARRMNQESLYFTRLCGDRKIELLTLQNSSMHAASQGRPREALQLVRSVLEGGYLLSPRLRGLFLTRKARALAQLGDENALKLFSEIRSLFLDGVSDTDPAWAWWVDERELLWHEAMVQRDLGLAQAVTNFERSVLGVPASETRSQYVHRSYLLRSQVENKSWAASEKTMREIIPLSAQVASTRAVVLLRNVLTPLEAGHRKIPPSLLEQASRLSAALDATAV